MTHNPRNRIDNILKVFQQITHWHWLQMELFTLDGMAGPLFHEMFLVHHAHFSLVSLVLFNSHDDSTTKCIFKAHQMIHFFLKDK